MGTICHREIGSNCTAIQHHAITFLLSATAAVDIVEVNKGKPSGSPSLLVDDQINFLNFAKLRKSVSQIALIGYLRKAKHTQHFGGLWRS